MMKKILTIIFGMLCTTGVFAQNTEERVAAFTDKDCYLTGENVLVKVLVTDANGQPQGMSKVAYIELCDTHGIQAQGMAQLNNGQGSAQLSLPGSLHSGNYQLAVYTRYMRNFSRKHYFRKIVSVLNVLHPTEEDEVEWIEQKETAQLNAGNALLTNAQSYGVRSEVKVLLPHESAQAQGLVLSVTRKDCNVPQYTPEEIADNMPQGAHFTPEIEGHWVTARCSNDAPTFYHSRLANVGATVKVFDGQLQKDGTMRYYTRALNGTQPVVVNAYGVEGEAYNMQLVSPFEGVIPAKLPALKVNINDKELTDRSMASQVAQVVRENTPPSPMPYNYLLQSVEPARTYDMDEYTKFKTVREVLIEFVIGVHRAKLEGHNHLFTLNDDKHGYSNWPALVLLDGVPMEDVDELLQYDARRLKYLHIYNGKFTFGDQLRQGVISFISRNADLSDYRLQDGAQFYTYDFPQAEVAVLSPVYDAETKAQFTPDFRHTLYWNPSVKGDCSFFTGDLPGIYRVTLQGMVNGKPTKWESEFEVK